MARYTQIPIKTSKLAPAETQAISHQLLLRAGFIEQVAAGIYSYLPLGLLTLKNIENIIREEMGAIDAEEILLPSLHPRKLWEESGRWQSYDPPLFLVKDRHNRQFALGPTHEEVIVDLARHHISSYKDLPFFWYQIQTKFRNEMRPTGGLLRAREFIMKDLYSFHESRKDLDRYYFRAAGAYQKIYQRSGLQAVMTEADSGSIGGSFSHEFMAISPTGEDTIFVCSRCQWAQNKELGPAKKCKNCSSEVSVQKAIEIGHIFKLGTKYSKKMKALFLDSKGQKKPIVMGCYGIGVSRLMAAIVEASHDAYGIIWPREVSPFKAHLISLAGAEAMAEAIYKKHQADFFYDDRKSVSAGEKFSEADLLGISLRIVVSLRTLETETVEIKKRNKKEITLVKISELEKYLVSKAS